jgi:hypothetical protein
VNCAYCGTALPADALFCGECGRSVPHAASPRNHAGAQSADRSSAVLCRNCGATMAASDIFCGECGFVSHTVNEVLITPRDTARIEPEAPAAAEPERRQPTPAAPPFEDDLESTRIVGRRPRGERFVLQFSTGESVTVYGSGLIGRSPHPEPGEHFDQVVRIVDATRSVSKTHLEFGQEAGAFWIKDRFSGNGTLVREPEAPPMRCLPDHRHRVVRGSRVDIGEQFFVVS